MKESIAVADDFMSLRRWNYDVVQEPNQTAVEPHRKEEKVCHSADQTGRDKPASPRTDRRDKSDGRPHYDKLRDYPKDNHASHVSSENDQRSSGWKQQPKFDRQGRPRCFQCNAYRPFAVECHSKPAVAKSKTEVNWVGALTQQ